MTSEPVSRKQPVAISFQEFRDEEIVEFFANKNRSFQPGSPASGVLARSRIVGAPHFSRGRKPTAAFAASSAVLDEEFSTEENATLRAGTRESSEESDVLFEDGPSIRVAPCFDRDNPCKKAAKKTAEPAFGKSPRPIGSLLGAGRLAGLGKPSKAAGIVSDPLDGKIRKSRHQRFEKSPFSVPSVSKTFQSVDDIPDKKEPIVVDDPKIEPEESAAVYVEPCETLPEESATVVSDPIEPGLETSILSRLAETDERLRQLIESWPRLSARLKETIAALVEVSS